MVVELEVVAGAGVVAAVLEVHGWSRDSGVGGGSETVPYPGGGGVNSLV